MEVNKFKSRKLIFASILLLIATIFILVDKAQFDEWGDFVKWIFGIYAAGNVGSEASKMLKKNGN